MLSNTAVPKYYGAFRDAVIRGEIPVCREIDLEMHRIDDLIADPMYGSMAICIMAGLTMGTVITLLLLPVFYSAFFNVKKQ